MRRLAWLFVLLSAAFARGDVTIEWDRASQRFIGPGGYARMIRLDDTTLLLAHEAGGQCVVRRSTDNGKTFGEPVRVTDYRFGGAANPELLKLADGRVMLLFNERPREPRQRGGGNDRIDRPRGAAKPYTIKLALSRDGGLTWTVRDKPLYEADTAFKNGCWEPAGIQLPNGDVHVYFANENPYRASDEQEITLLVARDAGRSWDKPRAVSFRKGHRDGMPVPLLLKGGIALAIEDNAGGPFQPAIVFTPLDELWKAPVPGEDARRWPALDPAPPRDVYAGAPYLRQLPTGETLLACQSTQALDGGDKVAERMLVYVGDADARGFAHVTEPFALPTNVKGQWNSLFVKDADTVVALTTTRLDGKSGVWMVEGRVKR